MSFGAVLRKTHRFFTLPFYLTVLMASIAVQNGKQYLWVTYLPLIPLFTLALTGLYMFVQPLVRKRRNENETSK